MDTFYREKGLMEFIRDQKLVDRKTIEFVFVCVSRFLEIDLKYSLYHEDMVNTEYKAHCSLNDFL